MSYNLLYRPGFRILNYYRKVLSDKLPLVSNVPAVCAVAAASRWHEFLQVNRGVRLCFSLQIYRGGKNHDTMRETPAAAGAACTAGHRTVLFS